MISNAFAALALGIGFAVTVSFLIVYVKSRQEEKSVDWKNFGRLVEQLAPIALAVIPGVPPALIPIIVHGIQTSEKLGGTGAEKKAQVIDLARTSITATNIAAGKQVIDPSTINAVSNGIDTVVGVVNVLQKQSVAPDADLTAPPA